MARFHICPYVSVTNMKRVKSARAGKRATQLSSGVGCLREGPRMNNGQLLALILLVPTIAWSRAVFAGQPARSFARFEGKVVAGQRYEKSFGPNLRFILQPSEYGWRVVIRDEREDEDISRLTPPFHFVPNPRDLEGWHFRNAQNTGPNDPKSGETVNAPGKIRDFIFSPEVGRTIDGLGATSSLTETDIKAVEAFGRGELRILEYELTDIEPGRRARFAWIRFSVTLSWPSQYRLGYAAPHQVHLTAGSRLGEAVGLPLVRRR